MLVGMAFGFLIVVMIGVASADETPSSDPALPVELASAVVVAAGANSLDTGAVASISADTGDTIERGTAFELDDGRIATVAHALIDARQVQVNGMDVDSTDAVITRQHDLASLPVTVALARSLSVADEDAVIGQTVALAGVGRDGRLTVVTGEIIARTSGSGYGVGRPDVFAISAEIEGGWSGGPVVNADGDVVAVIVGKELTSGVAIAVPIEYLPSLA